MDGIDIINEAIMNNNLNADTPAQVAPVKGKRGRRSKKEIEMAKALENKLNNHDVNNGENHVVLVEPKKEEEIVKPPPKKRGKKTKRR